MSRTITITAGGIELLAELNETATADAIIDALPIAAAANRWGEEIYFDIPVDSPQVPEATEADSVGDLGYWPPGKAFCIFFGPTPASTGDEPRAASPVNLVGRVLGDATELTDIPQGGEVTLKRADQE